MKKLLLTAAVFSTAMFGYAEEVVLDVANAADIQGTVIEETKKDDGTVQAAKHVQPLESLEINGYVFTFAKGEQGKTDPAYYWPTSTNPNGKISIRIYTSNEMTIKAPKDVYFTKIEITPDNSTKTSVLYTGEAVNEYKYVASATVRMNLITVTTGKQGEEPPVSDVVYENDFSSSLGDFTVLNKIENDFTGWKMNSSPKCAVANSYISSTKENLPADSYLISPVLDLKDRLDITMEFAMGTGFYFPTEANEFFTVLIKEATSSADWIDLPIKNFPPKPDSGNWTKEWPVNSYDLSAYKDKTVQIAFRYKNDGKASRAWEIKDFIVKGTYQNSVSDITVEETAPVYYNLQGMRIANPEKGLYIKVQNGKSSKVIF